MNPAWASDSIDSSETSSSISDNTTPSHQQKGNSSSTTSSRTETQNQLPSIVALLVGETGAGKSTFINYVANYFLKGRLDSAKIYRTVTEAGYEMHTETNLDDPTVSQTRKCTTYSFLKEGITYRFIDTPGLSDTSNSATEHVDDYSIHAILTAAYRTGELHAIILIINGSAPRLTVSLRNTLQRISGNYPDILLNNMMVVFTNCTRATRNFDEFSLPFPPKKCFIMNNSTFCSRPSEWNEEDWEYQELSWKQSMLTMKEIMEFIDNLAPQPTQVFKEMILSRNEINCQILRASTEIQKQQFLIDILSKLRNERNEAESRVIIHESEASSHGLIIRFLQLQEQSLQVNLIWQLKNLYNDARISQQELDTCFEMYEVYHIHEFEIRQKKQDFLEKKKTAEDEASAARKQKANIETMLADKDAELREVQRLLEVAQSIVEEKCRKLKRICKRFNFVEELNSTKESLYASLSTLTTTEARNNAEAFIRSLDRLADGLTEF